MSAERTTTRDVETTDLLARQEGAFERCAVTGVATVAGPVAQGENPSQADLTIPDSCFNARHIIVRLETVDGDERTLAFSPHFTAYDGRLPLLRELLADGYGWHARREAFTDGVRDWNSIVVLSREKAARVTEQGVPFGALSVGTLLRHTARIVTTAGGLLGNTHKRDRPEDVLTAYDRRHYDNDLPTGNADLDTFLRVAPKRRERAEIAAVPSHNRLLILKDGETFPLQFGGRATNNSHTPTALADALGVGTVENLAGEPISIAPNVSNALLPFTPVGSNKTDTFALAPPSE